MKASFSHSRAGSTLVLAASFIAVLSVSVGFALLGTPQIGRNSARTRSLQGAIAVGDAYTEWAFAQWRAKCRTQGNVTLPGSSFSPTLPPAGFLADPAGFQVSGFGVWATDVEGKRLTKQSPPPSN